MHTFNANLQLTVSPFYHYNQASYNASPNDVPVVTDVKQISNYGGAQASLAATIAKKNDIEAGLYGFAQRQSNFFNNFFWPVTWDRALIQGWETTLRSPAS